jgi:UDP-N-acetylglucosamine diphosphorylase / glucose-1-phosphate thymidylyltransferase / UDP-N-acetylgalactosamine diphosphorylase / glucosamine-1-phosphate N-acetyltransferase / galactosamine-1-phosphate N-acetyltransferase
MGMFPATDFLDLTHTTHTDLFPADQPVWWALGQISSYLQKHLRPQILGQVAAQAYVGEQVYIGEGSVVEPGAVIKGPAWIGKNCQVRAGCYIRENVIVGDGAVLGNSCEFKNCVIFDNCEVPHYNYVGDSILGYKAHLGAGVILSNVRLDRGYISVRSSSGLHETGLRKFGAIIADHAEVGCNSVINPGSIIGKRSIVYPLSNFAGVLAENSILKTRQSQQTLPRRD